MKAITAILCLCLFAIGAYAQQGSGTDDEKAANARLTAHLLINKIKAKIGNLKPDAAAIESEISANISAHQQRDASRQAARQLVQNKYEDWYAAEAKKVLDQVDADRPPNSGSWFGEDNRKKMLEAPSAEISQNLNTNLEAAFDEARKQAVTKQYSRLTVDVYPTEEEVDANDYEVLKKLLNERTAAKQSETLFEENQNQISTSIVDPIVADAYQQLRRQSEIVSGATGGEEVLPELIEQKVGSDLTKVSEAVIKAKAAQTGGPTKVYGTFPSVKAKIPERAKALAVEKFSNSLSQMPIAAKKDDVKGIIAKNPAEHATPEKSRKLLEEMYRVSVVKVAMDTYIKRVPANKQGALSRFVNDCAENDPACKTQLENLVKRSLDECFAPARQEVANDQLAEFFGPLANGSWKPDPAEINRRADLQVIEQLDPLVFKGTTSKPVDSRLLLDETKALASDKVKSLLEEGLTAFHQQMNWITSVEQVLTENLTKDKELPTEADFIKLFTEAVKLAWSKDQLAGKYPELFEKVSKECEVRAKALLPREKSRRKDAVKAEEARKADEAKQAKAAETQAAEDGKGPGEGTEKPGGSGGPGDGGEDTPQKKPKWVPDMIIDLDITPEGNVSAEIYLHPGEIDNITIPIIGDATPEQLTAFKLLYLRMLTERIKDKYFVYLRVFSRRISYGTVADFRESLKETVKQFDGGDRKFGVSWFDELMKERKNKGKTDDIDESLQFKGQSFVQVA